MHAPYFNPMRKSHVILIKFLEKELVNKKDKIEMCPYGPSTQHLFRNGKYLMTIDWKLV